MIAPPIRPEFYPHRRHGSTSSREQADSGSAARAETRFAKKGATMVKKSRQSAAKTCRWAASF
jgi:hypothetical protein